MPEYMKMTTQEIVDSINKVHLDRVRFFFMCWYLSRSRSA